MVPKMHAPGSSFGCCVTFYGAIMRLRANARLLVVVNCSNDSLVCRQSPGTKQHARVHQLVLLGNRLACTTIDQTPPSAAPWPRPLQAGTSWSRSCTELHVESSKQQHLSVLCCRWPSFARYSMIQQLLGACDHAKHVSIACDADKACGRHTQLHLPHNTCSK